MLNLTGYEIRERVYESARTQIVRGVRQSDGRKVVIKFLRAEKPGAQELAQFEREYRIAKELDLACSPKYLGLETWGFSKAIVMEEAEGESLDRHLGGRRLEMEEFLAVAERMAEALKEIHGKQVVHKDIKPQNILVNPKDGTVKVIDYSIAIRMKREVRSAVNPERLEGTLSYISPEQTGRMNRSVDYRSDFYSLGVTYYQMATGKLPYEAQDAMEMVHMHMAVRPKRPEEVEPTVPRAVSEIILKLMAKTAEERYQSADGLIADLRECRKRLKESGTIGDFRVGQKDLSERFEIPEKMYGRQAEVEALNREFLAASEGDKRVLFVSGSSGIGKTYLIQEVQKPLVSKKGYFISGKFDQLRKNIPYSGIIQAFQDLIRQILTETEGKIRGWKEEILAALGAGAQVIVDVVPELTHIIGEQPAAPEVGGAEAENRFNYLFLRFIKVFTQKDHPVVMFLDDLQWMDLASAKWLETALKDEEIRHLFFIASYRSTEIDKIQLLTRLLEELKKAAVPWKMVELKPLEDAQICELIQDVFHVGKEGCGGLSDVIKAKTGGNPFFVIEFLKMLYQEELVRFDGGWTWDLGKIRMAKVTDNVVDFMGEKVKKLPKAARTALEYASCVGVKFYFDTIEQVLGKSAEDAEKDLAPAVDGGMIVRMDRVGYFAHDRIQESVYNLMTEAVKKKTHYEIGKTLLKGTPPEQLEERIFAVLYQLNAALELVTDRKEREQVLELNIRAGEKAKASAAYDAARDFFSRAEALLPGKAWKEDYVRALKTFTELGEVHYLARQYDEAERYFEVVLKNAKTALDKVKVYELRIILYTSRMQHRKAFEIGLEAFRMLKFPMPKKAGVLNVALELMAVNRAMGRKKPADLLDLPMLTDARILAIHKILMPFNNLCYFYSANHFAISILKLVTLSIRYGNSVYSCYGYIGAGVLYTAYLGMIDRGYAFGQLGLKLLDKTRTTALEARIKYLYYTLIQHFKENNTVATKYYPDIYEKGLENGDLIYSAYCIVSHLYFNTYFNLFRGKEQYEQYYPALKKLDMPDMTLMASYQREFNLTLLGENADKLKITGQYFDEDKAWAEWTEKKLGTNILTYSVMRLIIFYLYRRHRDALEYAEQAWEYLNSGMGFTTTNYYLFFYCASLLAAYPSAGKRDRKRYLKRIREIEKKLKKLAHFGPSNYEHKYLYIQAEKARVFKTKKPIDILRLYDRAIDSVRANGYVYEAGMFAEQAGRYCRELGLSDAARGYLSDALGVYRNWGAVVKARELAEEFRGFVFGEAERAGAAEGGKSVSVTTTQKTDKTGSTSTTSQILDMTTVLKASTAISGEIVMDRLLGMLVGILMENVGAEKAVLLLDRDGELYAAAQGESGSRETRILGMKKLEEYGEVPESVVRLVGRTREAVVLDDAAGTGKFMKDEYVKNRGVKSVLCAPVLHQGKSVGLVYLENNLSTGAFTKDRMDVLTVLSGQIGVSLENAKLYEELEDYSHNLERKVEDRTAELNQANLDLKGKQEQIQSELDVARLVQRSLVPDEEHIPKYDRIEFGTLYVPMEDIGGDLYDIIPLGSTETAVVVLDVSGHGVPAALITTMSKTAFDHYSRPGVETADTCRKINDEMVKQIGDLEHYLTAFYARLDVEKNTLEYTNCGHPAAVLYRPGEDRLEMLEGGGTIIGSFGGMEFTSRKVELRKGDLVVIYTDGITEAKNPAGELYGEDRFYSLIRRNGKSGAREIVKIISGDVETFCGGRPATDDRTMLALKIG